MDGDSRKLSSKLLSMAQLNKLHQEQGSQQ